MEKIEAAWKKDQTERNGRWGDIQDYRNMLEPDSVVDMIIMGIFVWISNTMNIIHLKYVSMLDSSEPVTRSDTKFKCMQPNQLIIRSCYWVAGYNHHQGFTVR